MTGEVKPLFLQQAGMAGDALPFAEVQHPRVGETPHVVIWFALIRTLRVINSRNYRGIAKKIHFHILDVGQGRLEMRVFDIGKKFLLVAEFAVVFSVDKPA